MRKILSVLPLLCLSAGSASAAIPVNLHCYNEPVVTGDLAASLKLVLSNEKLPAGTALGARLVDGVYKRELFHLSKNIEKDGESLQLDSIQGSLSIIVRETARDVFSATVKDGALDEVVLACASPN
jgi:hypothetical protein